MAKRRAADRSVVSEGRGRGGPPRVTKGGDGGAAVPEAMRHGGSFAHDSDNARRCLVGRSISDREGLSRLAGLLVPSTDPTDVAHNQRDAQGSAYLPNCDRAGAPRPGLEGSRRRLVLQSEIGRDGLHYEHAAFMAHVRQQRIGADLGAACQVAMLTEIAIGRMAPVEDGRLRDLLHPRTTQALTARELELERQGSRLLKTGRSTPRTPHAGGNAG